MNSSNKYYSIKMTEESDSAWLSQWESNLITESQDKQQNIVDNLEQDNINVQAKLWAKFQNCATSIAKVGTSVLNCLWLIIIGGDRKLWGF